MAAGFVRHHNRGWASPGVTNPTLAAAVPADRVLLMLVALSGNTSGGSVPPSQVTGIGKPVGESNSWVQLTPAGTEGVVGSVELWGIKTSVEWSSGYAVAVSAGSSRWGAKVSEFSGVTVTLRSSPAPSSVGEGATRSVAASGATTGDLAVGVVGFGSRAFQAEFEGATPIAATYDGDSTSGSWSTVSIVVDDDSLDPTAVVGGLQYKIPVSSGTQTYDVAFNFTLGAAGPATTAKSAMSVVVLARANVAPNAPALVSPADGSILNRLADVPLTWTFSDPDTGDTQGDADIRYRVVGAPSWTTVSGTSAQSYTITAGTLAVGDYEWQVRTYDQDGLVGPYSTSGFFTAADPPDPPVLVVPTEGQQVGATLLVEWTAAEQDAYRISRKSDNGGAVGETVYFTTPTITNPSARERFITFDVPDRTEHVVIEIQFDGIWSAPDSASVNVFFEPPATPTRTLTPIKIDPDDRSESAIQVDITNPTPVGDQQVTTSNEVWTAYPGEEPIRIAKDVAVNGSWTYYTPPSGVDHDPILYVVARSANGGRASSAA